MTQLSQSISNLRTYISWYNSGGPMFTNMNTNSFSQLSGACNQALLQFLSLNAGIEKLKNNWQNLQQSNASATIEGVLLSGLLKDLSAQSSALISTCSVIKSTSVSLSAAVNAQIYNLQNAIQAEQNQYNQAQQDYSNAVMQFNNAQNQLSGSSGFLNGFITGITLGIDNKVKDEEDAASNAKAAAQNSMITSQLAMETIQKEQNSLNSCTGTITQLNNVIDSATTLQNTINSTYADCEKAATDAQASAASSSQTVEQIFINLAEPALTSLFSLGAELNAAINP